MRFKFNILDWLLATMLVFNTHFNQSAYCILGSYSTYCNNKLIKELNFIKEPRPPSIQGLNVDNI